MSEWTSEQFFESADEYYNTMFAYFQKAKVSIDFEVYIFEESHIGDRLLKELAKAAARGLCVRLLVDGFGSLNFIEHYKPKYEGIDIKIYHPVPWKRWTTKSAKASSSWEPQTFVQLFANINSRDHRKVCIIDNEHAFLGSFNVTDVHLEDTAKQKAWRDYGVSVTGKCVELLTFSFKKAWFSSVRDQINIKNLRTSIELKKYYRYFLLNHSIRSRLEGRHRILAAMRNAEKRIWIVTPYFIPTFRLIHMLKAAAEKGLDVRLLLPLNNDVIFMHTVMKTYYEMLIKSGVKIFEYKPSMHHAKVSVIDDWCALGSMNLNSRSIMHDLEANYILQTDIEKKKLFEALQKDFQNSVLINKTNHWTWYERWGGQLLLMFKHWI